MEIADQCWDSWNSIKDRHNQKKDDNKNQDASKSSDSAHCIVAHCNLGINEMTATCCDCCLNDLKSMS